MNNPTPEQIVKLRNDARLTQTQAAELVYSPLRTYQGWELGESKMHPAIYELLTIKVKEHV